MKRRKNYESPASLQQVEVLLELAFLQNSGVEANAVIQNSGIEAGSSNLGSPVEYGAGSSWADYD
jgi:hypothetical protein